MGTHVPGPFTSTRSGCTYSKQNKTEKKNGEILVLRVALSVRSFATPLLPSPPPTKPQTGNCIGLLGWRTNTIGQLPGCGVFDRPCCCCCCCCLVLARSFFGSEGGADTQRRAGDSWYRWSQRPRPRDRCSETDRGSESGAAFLSCGPPIRGPPEFSMASFSPWEKTEDGCGGLFVFESSEPSSTGTMSLRRETILRAIRTLAAWRRSRAILGGISTWYVLFV